MTAPELLACLRQHGVILRAEGDRLRGDAPKGVLIPALRHALVALKGEVIRLLGAEADTGRLALDVFPGATVVGNVKTPARLEVSIATAKPHVKEPPAVRCPTCRNRDWWQQPGRAWVCGICHPNPRRVGQGPVCLDVDGEHAGLLELAEKHGFPRLTLRPGVAVMRGEARWRKFVVHPSAEDLAAARATLEAL